MKNSLDGSLKVSGFLNADTDQELNLLIPIMETIPIAGQVWRVSLKNLALSIFC